MQYRKAPGVEDIFPDKIDKWNYILNTAKKTAADFNIKEIVTPVMEFTELFARGIGDETDIVSKEMFTFEDRGGRSLTLRPEGTASVVRAFCENGDYNRLSTAKFFYCGPMFRAEKPQKGRLRQFNQFGVEIFGEDSPLQDFEAVSLMDTVAKRLGFSDYKLLINSIGCDKCRPDFMKALKEYYSEKKDQLCNDCKVRLDKNPLRLLDCKVESCKNLKKDAPKIREFLCDDCNEHHTVFKKYLDNAGIFYVEDDYLVRGLDYYCKTTFEFVTDKLGGQNAFSAGGRYNKLVETFGGKPTPAVGFAAGIERIFLMLDDEVIPENGIDAYFVHFGEAATEKAVEIAFSLRKAGLSVDMEPVSRGFKAQLKKADREKAKYAVIIGEDELASGEASVKNLKTGEQANILFADIADYCLK